MRSIAIHRFGGPEVLAPLERTTPRPGPGEVAIDVAFAGLNFGEVLFRRGVLPDLPLPFVPGLEASGRVRALGEGVSGLKPGQRVVALTIVGGGAYAEVAIAPAALVVPVPDGIDLATAAGLPSNLSTAMQILHDVAPVRAGETVLVHAAAGGVGGLLGQVAKAAGAGRVIGTVGSPAKRAHALARGYDEVIVGADFIRDPQAALGEAAVTLAIDPVGGDLRRASLQALAPHGRLVVMGNASDAPDVTVSTQDLWFSGRSVGGYILLSEAQRDPARVSAALRRGLEWVAEGRIRAEVSEVLALDDAAEAHRRIESRATTGKLVFRVQGD